MRDHVPGVAEIERRNVVELVGRSKTLRVRIVGEDVVADVGDQALGARDRRGLAG
jgi:hypothetical protein